MVRIISLYNDLIVKELLLITVIQSHNLNNQQKISNIAPNTLTHYQITIFVKLIKIALCFINKIICIVL